MRTLIFLFALGLVMSGCNTKNNNPFSEFNKSNHLQPKINKADFYQLTGFDFGWLALEPINIAQPGPAEIALAKRLSPGQKALYFWWYLDAEVTNA